jgi:adenosine deaminase
MPGHGVTLQVMPGFDEAAERAWLRTLPKTEIHVHLEGSIPLEALWRIMQKHGGDPDVPGPEALRERFRFRDFPHFIRTWMWKTKFLRDYEDFTLIGEAVAREFARQGISYAEAFFTPLDHEERGLEPGRLVQALRAGFSRIGEVDIHLIADLGRDYGPLRGARLLEQLAEIGTAEVLGIGLGGSEQTFPAEPFADVFERARKLGFHTTAHAGEAAGAHSVRAAVEVLRAQRIGHGTRAVEDPAVVDLLARRKVPVECCPISNVRTAVIGRIEEHPLAAFLERGIMASVNTDDPAMFDTSMEEELLALRTRLGLSRGDVLRVLENGIDSTWAPSPRKVRLRAALAAAAAG